MLDSRPHGWPVAKIEEICAINPEALPSKTDPDFVFHYVAIDDVVEGSIVSFSEVYFGEAPSRARRVVRNGDVIVSTVRPYLKAFSKVTDAEDEYVASTGFCVLRPKPGITTQGYIEHLVFSEPFIDYLKSRMTGSNYPAVKASDIKMFEVRLPSLPEQERIAEVLSSVDDSIRATQGVIAQAERVKRGLMEDLLTGGLGSAAIARGEVPEGWVATVVGEACQKVSVGIASSTTHAYSDSGVPILRNKNIKEGFIDDTDLLYITEAFHKQSITKALREGDVISMRTGYTGTSAVVPAKYDGCQTFTTLISRPDPEMLLGEYLANWMNSPAGKRLVGAWEAGGAQPNLNAGVLKKIPLILPSVSEQRRVCAVLSSVFQVITDNKRAAAQMLELKRGLMDDLLTGRVRTM